MGWNTLSQPAGLMGFNWQAAQGAADHNQYVMSQKPGMMTANPYLQKPNNTPEQSMRDRVFGEYQKQLDKSNAANEQRYGEIKSLYGGLLGQPNLAVGQGIDTPGAGPNGANGQTLFGAGAMPAPFTQSQSNNQGISLNQWGAGGMDKSGPLWGPQASQAMADYSRRGLGDSTAAFNKQVLGNSMDLANLQQRSIDTGMRQNQLSYQQSADQRDYATDLYRQNQGRRDNLTGQLAQVIEGRNDIAPDINPLLQMAAMEGQGTTEGMYAPQVDQGGGGGMGNLSYGGFANNPLPMPYFSTQGAYAPQKWKQQIAQRKQAPLQAAAGMLGGVLA